MKDFLSLLVFIIIDFLSIGLSVLIAYWFVHKGELIEPYHTLSLVTYLSFLPLYFINIGVLAYEGIYTHRYDFWQETRLIVKALFFSFLLLITYLTVSHSLENFSVSLLVSAYLIMAFIMPFFKRFTKFFLYKIGWWRKKASVFGNDPMFKKEIFGNHYLGYIEAKNNDNKTVFIDSKTMALTDLKRKIDAELHKRHEVLFIPLLNDFDLTQSYIYELSNTRTNLIRLQNRLKSRFRRIVKYLFDVVASIILLPFLLPILGWITYTIKKEEPEGSILFIQERLGKDGKIFRCYKFRTMVENGDEILTKYLKEHPEEKEYYDKYHKYMNDPRITKIGAFLRKTSLDELPQIFNVLKGEMSLVGPRPYMIDEKEKIGERVKTILSVRPGITGLWQVSGRNEVDFYERVDMDMWYIRNWNLWMDIVILFKTVKAVLAKKGAS